MGVTLIFLLVISCNSEEVQTKYFTKLTGIISPYMDYQPRGELFGKDTLMWSYYKVEYDTKNRMTRISYFMKNLRSDNSYFGTHEVRYNYSSGEIRRTYFDKSGKESSMWRHYYLGENIHEERFELDKFGNKERLILYDTSLQRVENGLGSFEYVWETIDQGTFIQRQFKKDGSPNVLTTYFPFEIARISKDDRGHLSRIENVDELGVRIQQQEAGFADVVFDFDNYGNEISWKFYNALGEPVNRMPYGDIDYGYSQWIHTFNWIDPKLGLAEKFDEKYFDPNGNPVENNHGIHHIKYTIKPFGELGSIAFYDLNGGARIHPSYGFHKLVNTFDETGSLVENTRYDTLGAVVK